MRSRWFELKTKILARRRQGWSIGSIEKKFGIPRSTLSGWFKSIKLTARQKKKLIENRDRALIKARKRAVLWHNNQKAQRLLEAELAAKKIIADVNIKNKSLLDLALAMLYLGEGLKGGLGTVMGSSDPKILRFFVSILKNNYNLTANDIKCDLHLRADQSPKKVKKFWSRELRLPVQNFLTVSIDNRTRGTVTYPNYMGVCVVRCGRSAIQRKLLSIAKLFCERVIDEYMGG